MSDKPIIMTGESVRAILDWRKTQTRRVIKPQPIWIGDPNIPFKTPDANPKGIIKSRYQVGDKLWVKETWLQLDRDHWENENKPVQWIHNRYGVPRANGIAYRADTSIEGDETRMEYGYKWKSPLFMPKTFARLWLEVTAVKAERLQDISEEDVIAEAIYVGTKSWDAINARRGYSWESNPWVWAYTFKRIEK